MAPPSSPSRIRRLVLLWGAAGLFVATAAARLQWESPEIAAKIRADEKESHACFRFVNTGERPVTITAIRPGCGCTVPTLAKSTYAPGERGEFTITYHVGNREGHHRVDIAVDTDDGAGDTVAFVADIEALVSFDTRFVYWKGDEPRRPKRLRLTFAPDQSARLLQAESSNPQFTVAFRAVGNSGREYEIEVTPPAEARNYTAVTLHTLVGSDQVERQFTVVARTM